MVARWPCDVGGHHCCGHSVGVRKDPHTCGGIKAVGACACFQRRIDCGGNLLSTFRGGRDIETSISGTDTGRAYLNRDGVPTPIRLTNLRAEADAVEAGSIFCNVFKSFLHVRAERPPVWYADHAKSAKAAPSPTRLELIWRAASSPGAKGNVIGPMTSGSSEDAASPNGVATPGPDAWNVYMGDCALRAASMNQEGLARRSRGCRAILSATSKAKSEAKTTARRPGLSPSSAMARVARGAHVPSSNWGGLGWWSRTRRRD